MMATVEAINGLYVIVTDGTHRWMNDSTFEQLMALEVGDRIEIDEDELADYWLLEGEI